MAHHAITRSTVVDHAFSYIVYGKCIVYHGLPVSKHHDILPWFLCFKTPWITMVSIVYHGILPWFTMVSLFQNTMVFSMEYDGIFS